MTGALKERGTQSNKTQAERIRDYYKSKAPRQAVEFKRKKLPKNDPMIKGIVDLIKDYEAK